MSAYNSFAIAGLGRIGVNLAQELLAAKVRDPQLSYSVRLLTRSPGTDTVKELVASDAEVRTVSYEEPATILAALEDVDVLICTIGFAAIDAENILYDQAKKAPSLKLFVPSEYGARSDKMSDRVFAVKETFRQKLIADRIKYTVFYTGFWADFDLRPMILKDWFGIDLEGGIVHKWHDWDTPLSFTTQMDIARFVAHALVYLPRSHLEDKILRIEGDRQSMASLVSAFLEKTGRPKLTDMAVTVHSRQELDEELARDAVKDKSEDALAKIGLRLLRAADDGMFCVLENPDAEGELANGLWPEWKPEKAVDVIIRSFAVPTQAV
ncbi:NAD-P-binding protein [Mycena polygramma]|nr:NAD-P-binding protein [Mycena polygramma]